LKRLPLPFSLQIVFPLVETDKQIDKPLKQKFGEMHFGQALPVDPFCYLKILRTSLKRTRTNVNSLSKIHFFAAACVTKNVAA
jgi:hypothetical protein